MDSIFSQLGTELAELVRGLGGQAAGGSLQRQLHAATEAIASAVQAALVASSPLLIPLCQLLSLRADAMAKHLVTRLHAAVLGVARVPLAPDAAASAVLVRAGLCLEMAAVGVPQVPA